MKHPPRPRPKKPKPLTKRQLTAQYQRAERLLAAAAEDEEKF